MVNEGRVAMVTGAGSGIGRGVAVGLLQAGYSVVLVGRRLESLHETAQLAAVATQHVLSIPADVTDADAVDVMLEQTVATFGRLDLLFNNAGANVRAVPIDELSVDEWHTVINVNLTGAFLCTRAAFRQMKSQSPMGGRIINNGSISAQAPRPFSAPYTASKHGLTGLTKSTALDGRKYKIACGQIDIGNVDTAMAARAHTGALQPNGQVVLEPTFALEHVVQAVLYLASLPLDVNVLQMTVLANEMPFVGRG